MMPDCRPGRILAHLLQCALCSLLQAERVGYHAGASTYVVTDVLVSSQAI